VEGESEGIILYESSELPEFWTKKSAMSAHVWSNVYTSIFRVVNELWNLEVCGSFGCLILHFSDMRLLGAGRSINFGVSFISFVYSFISVSFDLFSFLLISCNCFSVSQGVGI
jgi:hypothetical protein